MGDSTSDSLASLLPRECEDVGGTKHVGVRLTAVVCGCAFILGLVFAIAIWVLAQRNRALESGYDSQAAAAAAEAVAAGKAVIVFPNGDLFKQPTRISLSRTSKRPRKRRLQAAPHLVEKNRDRWRLVRVTRRRKASHGAVDGTRGTISKDFTGTSSAKLFGRRLNGSLEKEPYDAATELSRPLLLVHSIHGVSEHDLRLNRETPGAKDGANATADVMPESAVNWTDVVPNSSAMLLVSSTTAGHGPSSVAKLNAEVLGGTEPTMNDHVNGSRQVGFRGQPPPALKSRTVA